MKENLTKDQYLLPECRVIEIKLNGAILTASTTSDSLPTWNDGGDLDTL